MLETNELNQAAMITIAKNPFKIKSKNFNKIALPGRFRLDIFQYQQPLQ